MEWFLPSAISGVEDTLLLVSDLILTLDSRDLTSDLAAILGSTTAVTLARASNLGNTIWIGECGMLKFCQIGLPEDSDFQVVLNKFCEIRKFVVVATADGSDGDVCLTRPSFNNVPLHCRLLVHFSQKWDTFG